MQTQKDDPSRPAHDVQSDTLATVSPRSSRVKDLFLLFSIPLAISVMAAAAVYVPRLLANPTYDFVYTYCEDYDCADTYSAASDGRVTMNVVSSSSSPSSPLSSSSQNRYNDSVARLAYFDVASGASKLIDYNEAQKYQLSTSSISPDGYSLVRAGDDGGSLFGGNYSVAWHLEDGMKKRPIKLAGSDSNYSNNIKLLGWVRR